MFREYILILRSSLFCLNYSSHLFQCLFQAHVISSPHYWNFEATVRIGIQIKYDHYICPLITLWDKVRPKKLVMKWVHCDRVRFVNLSYNQARTFKERDIQIRFLYLFHSRLSYLCCYLQSSFVSVMPVSDQIWSWFLSPIYSMKQSEIWLMCHKRVRTL